MLSPWIFWEVLAFSFSPLSPEAWDTFGLVKKLNSPIVAERERIQEQLTARPAAVWAVFWGTQQDDAEIYHRSVAILKTWKARRDERQLADLVRSVNGDF